MLFQLASLIKLSIQWPTYIKFYCRQEIKEGKMDSGQHYRYYCRADYNPHSKQLGRFSRWWTYVFLFLLCLTHFCSFLLTTLWWKKGKWQVNVNLVHGAHKRALVALSAPGRSEQRSYVFPKHSSRMLLSKGRWGNQKVRCNVEPRTTSLVRLVRGVNGATVGNPYDPLF